MHAPGPSGAAHAGGIGVGGDPMSLMDQSSKIPDELLGPRCRRCGSCSKSTTHMRSGPEGRGTLCNACGLAWRKGKLRKVIKFVVPPENLANSKMVPEIDMEFEDEDQAYQFYNNYAGITGFSVRKSRTKSTENVLKFRTFVCSRQGFRMEKKGAKEVKKPRPETRIGCPARLTIRIAPNGRYRVTEFVRDHNHQPAPPSTTHMLRSQIRTQLMTPDAQDADAEMSDDSRATEKSADENMGRQVGGPPHVDFLPVDYKVCLRSKRMKSMQMGDAEATLKYLLNMQLQNPSFFYAVQLDEDDRLTNIFWADEKALMDFNCFSDVVCLDTTYKVNGYSRPFTPFVGVNHHKQLVIFGAALLYDETVESFKWLFETFKIAMHGKQPKTILTEQSMVIEHAVAEVWPGTSLRFCPWQLYQNAIEHLNYISQGSKSLLNDFGRCVYDYENEEEFLLAWRMLLEKYELRNNGWLSKLFEERHKWALAYERETFYGDIINTLRSESLSSTLKKLLSPQTDLSSFFKQYERLIDDYRYAELQADSHASQSVLKVLPSKMLRQAADLYTPAVYEMFWKEFEVFMNCMLFSGGELEPITQYKITVGENQKEFYVRFVSSDFSVTCNCKKFESMGIQCGHVLKVLDFRNIKELPERYFLKRWRKDARVGFERDHEGIIADNFPKSPSTTPVNMPFSSYVHDHGLRLATQLSEVSPASDLQRPSFHGSVPVVQGYPAPGPQLRPSFTTFG